MQLIASLTQFFSSQNATESIDGLFLGSPDLLVQDIKNLVDEYKRQHSQKVASVKSVVNEPKKVQTQDAKKSIIDIIKQLEKNIDKKALGRQTWFHANADTKIAKLKTIQTWLEGHEASLTATETKVILALIRDSCAIKRNTWGIFQPHSLTEFKNMCAKSQLEISEDISFDSSQLRILENIIDGSEFINKQITQLPSLNWSK